MDKQIGRDGRKKAQNSTEMRVQEVIFRGEITIVSTT